MPIDRNAIEAARIRRNWQRLSGQLTGQVAVTSPLTNSGTAISLTLAASGGLENSSGLRVKGLRTTASDPTPADGDAWYNSTVLAGKMQVGSAIGRIPLVLSSQGNGTPVANTTTRTSFALTYVLPANLLTVGRAVRLKFSGLYGATGTPTLQLAGWFNGLGGAAADGATFTITPNTSGRFYVELTANLTTAGSSGVINLGGYVVIEAAGANLFQTLGQTGLAINTTIANTVDASAQWNTANVANTCNIRSFLVELL